MKKYLVFTLSVCVLFFACNNEETNNSGDNASSESTLSTDLVKNPESASGKENINQEDLPQMTFAETEYVFGEIQQGDVVKHDFIFTNTGHSDLIITNAKASCGCTVPYYPQEPIASGASDTIKVSFNSKGKSGKTTKSITVTHNGVPNKSVIYIKGDIIVPEETL